MVGGSNVVGRIEYGSWYGGIKCGSIWDVEGGWLREQ
jgi:hypothetical protein